MYTLHINGWTPPAICVAIALREKGLEFAVAEHDWTVTPDALNEFAGTAELLHTLEGEFPILTADEVALSDSHFILEYLDDRHPKPPLKPADAYGQWQVQALDRFLGERALPAISTLGVTQFLSGREWSQEIIDRFAHATEMTPERRDAWRDALTAPATTEAVSESNRKLALLYERLDKALSSNARWLLGELYSLADIAAFTLVHPFLSSTLPAGGVDVPARVRTWHERVRRRPAVALVLAEVQPSFLPGPEHARWG
jgi:GST-like protein